MKYKIDLTHARQVLSSDQQFWIRNYFYFRRVVRHETQSSQTTSEGEVCGLRAAGRRREQLTGGTTELDADVGVSQRRGLGNRRGWGKREIPEKTHRPTASSGTIPTSDNPGATPLGIEPCTNRWEANAVLGITFPPPPLPNIDRQAREHEARSNGGVATSIARDPRTQLVGGNKKKKSAEFDRSRESANPVPAKRFAVANRAQGQSEDRYANLTVTSTPLHVCVVTYSVAEPCSQLGGRRFTAARARESLEGGERVGNAASLARSTSPPPPHSSVIQRSVTAGGEAAMSYSQFGTELSFMLPSRGEVIVVVLGGEGVACSHGTRHQALNPIFDSQPGQRAATLPSAASSRAEQWTPACYATRLTDVKLVSRIDQATCLLRRLLVDDRDR
ncbi:hypothetical protein PR048_030667 [Dryococelus australis]|uniref:Uncharacterized protein n=1 Tax=Dryococelus australis TaxID=614101 RepID=A0ABQ9GA14_9NEOP|nr:hypothetical protein PR048_030667 [Dryococelus australis]